VIVSTEPVAEPAGRGGERVGDRAGDRNGERDRGGDTGSRRSRGRGRRDEPSTDRPRRLPEVITPTVLPDRGDASLDVGAPAPAAERTEGAGSEAAVPGTVEPATLESVRDDVEEVVVEQALAQERNRHTAAVSTEPARNGAAEVVPPVDLANNGVAGAVTPESVAPGAVSPEPVSPESASPGSGPASAPNGVPIEEAEPPRAPRRRGRVTRTAGAPATAPGEAPAVTVVTVPATVEVPDAAGSDAAGSDAAGSDAAGSDAAGSDAAGSDAAGPDAAVLPAPAAPARPRRARRAASRPAGPPAAEVGGDPV
jgi:ribonuclease E